MKEVLIVLALLMLSVGIGAAYDDKEILAVAKGVTLSSFSNHAVNITIAQFTNGRGDLVATADFGSILQSDTGLEMMIGDLLKVAEQYLAGFQKFRQSL